MPPELPAVRILLVDDDKAICEYMQTLLERDGFQVKALSDPTGVEDEVRNGGYHLIILDLMMPKLDGIEVLRRIRKLDTDIAVVIFTGFPNLESAVASMKLDAVDYIKKPFNVDEFREVLSRVMRKKGLARTPEEQLHRVIGDTIRNLRKEKDLTLKQMAERTITGRWQGSLPNDQSVSLSLVQGGGGVSGVGNVNVLLLGKVPLSYIAFVGGTVTYPTFSLSLSSIPLEAGQITITFIGFAFDPNTLVGLLVETGEPIKLTRQ